MDISTAANSSIPSSQHTMIAHPLQETFLFLPFVAFFVSFYYLVSPFYKTPKQKSWILTATSSFIMTSCSLPFVFDYLSNGCSVKAIRTSSDVAFIANRLFQSYLVSDLAMGLLHYREQVNLLSGWIHHTLYIFVVDCAIRNSWTHLFAFCSAMELPTFVMALGSMHPKLRSDLIFAASFFFTRIFLHAVLIVSYLLPSNRNSLLRGSFVPSSILSAAFLMHAMWFKGCIAGFLRRAKSKKEKEAGTPVSCVKSTKSEATVDSPSGDMSVTVSDASPSFATSRKRTQSTSSESSSPSGNSDEQADRFTHVPPPARPWTFARRNSIDRAIQTYHAMQAAKLELSRAVHKLRQSERYRDFQQARRNVYQRLPDRRLLMDYVGLGNRQHDVAVAAY